MLWVCASCTTKYAVGLEQCPQCGSTEYVEQGEEMPKITSQGVTDKTDPDLTVAEQLAVQRGEDLEEFRNQQGNEEGDNSSAGNNSSTSTDKHEKTETKSPDKDQSPVRTTENLSAKDLTGSFTVHSTDGSPSGKKSGK